MIFPPIQTKRLLLREFKIEDINSVHNYASDAEVVRYSTWGPNNEQDTKEFLDSVLKCQSDKHRYHYEVAVVTKYDNILIGTCGINVENPDNNEGWIGYCYNKYFWGNGYATEASKAIINFGFSQLNLHRIFATCDTSNIGSEMVLKKIGMVKEGHLRENKWQKGKYRDSFIYSILDYEHNSNS